MITGRHGVCLVQGIESVHTLWFRSHLLGINSKGLLRDANGNLFTFIYKDIHYSVVCVTSDKCREPKWKYPRMLGYSDGILKITLLTWERFTINEKEWDCLYGIIPALSIFLTSERKFTEITIVLASAFNFLPCIFLYFADLDHKLLCDQEKKNLLKYLRRLLKMYSAVIKWEAKYNAWDIWGILCIDGKIFSTSSK